MIRLCMQIQDPHQNMKVFIYQEQCICGWKIFCTVVQSKANKNFINEIVVSKSVYDDLLGYKNKLDKLYQDMFKYNLTENFYHGSIIRMDMDDWLDNEKQKNPCTR